MSSFVRRMVKVPGSKLINCRGPKMKDPIDSCSVSISNLEIRVMFGFRIH